jgi:hypothetical protein
MIVRVYDPISRAKASCFSKAYIKTSMMDIHPTKMVWLDLEWHRKWELLTEYVEKGEFTCWCYLPLPYVIFFFNRKIRKD